MALQGKPHRYNYIVLMHLAVAGRRLDSASLTITTMSSPSLTIHLSRPTSPILQIAFLRLLDLVVAGPSPQYVGIPLSIIAKVFHCEIVDSPCTRGVTFYVSGPRLLWIRPQCRPFRIVYYKGMLIVDSIVGVQRNDELSRCDGLGSTRLPGWTPGASETRVWGLRKYCSMEDFCVEQFEYMWLALATPQRLMAT
ncbi:hypothetical protein BD779DRAFT_1794701 [Infundibulicybe gibba]|nr:hypothetical protein BD779DRAFT_1794701 [Infundibulicybe gibba]